MPWSVTVYNKNLSSQLNLTAQIEPVQNKIKYIYCFSIHNAGMNATAKKNCHFFNFNFKSPLKLTILLLFLLNHFKYLS
jgi:hypothetical protein